MLDFSKTSCESSIEEYFAKKFHDLTKYPMDNYQANLFIRLTQIKDNDMVIPEKDKPFIYRILEKRIEALHTYTTDNSVLLFISAICKTAGQGVMYCWYLQYMSCKLKKKHISFDDFAQIFSQGFPSDDALLKLWVCQKVKTDGSFNSDNLLDYHTAGLSIM